LDTGILTSGQQRLQYFILLVNRDHFYNRSLIKMELRWECDRGYEIAGYPTEGSQQTNWWKPYEAEIKECTLANCKRKDTISHSRCLRLCCLKMKYQERRRPNFAPKARKIFGLMTAAFYRYKDLAHVW
jgi:hypothetical protein